MTQSSIHKEEEISPGGSKVMKSKDSENISNKQFHCKVAPQGTNGQANIHKVYESEVSPGGSKVMEIKESQNMSNKDSLNEFHYEKAPLGSLGKQASINKVYEEEISPGGSTVMNDESNKTKYSLNEIHHKRASITEENVPRGSKVKIFLYF